MKTVKKIISLVVCLILICSLPMGVFADKEAETTAEALETDLFITDREPAKDYAYSFAVIGDTQTLTADYPDKLSCIYERRGVAAFLLCRGKRTTLSGAPEAVRKRAGKDRTA